MFTQKDLAQLTSRNIEPARVEEQLEAFHTGFPYLTIDRAAVVADGIVKLDPEKAVEQAARAPAQQIMAAAWAIFFMKVLQKVKVLVFYRQKNAQRA